MHAAKTANLAPNLKAARSLWALQPLASYDFLLNSEHCLNLKNKPLNHEKRLSNLDQNLAKYGSADQILLSERATACFLFSEDSKFLAFSEWTADKMQIIKILRLADMSIKTDNKRKRVVEFLSFDDGLLKILDSPIFMPKNYTLDIHTLFNDKI